MARGDSAPSRSFMSMNWTEIILGLGVPAISGFFMYLSRRQAIKARYHADNARASADVATRASLKALRRSEFDLPPESED